MKKVVTYDKDGTLCCDNPYCCYRETQELNLGVIGAKCPMCGAVMATAWDYLKTWFARRSCDLLNLTLGWWLGEEEDQLKKHGARYNASVRGRLSNRYRRS